MGLYKQKFNPVSGQFNLVPSSTSGITFKDSVATQSALPPTGNTVNDARLTNDTGHLYIWSGSTWVDQGDFISLNWADIVGKPTSTPGDIDDAVSKRHTAEIFEQYLRDTLLVGNTWTITHSSDANNKRIIFVTAANDSVSTLPINPDNVSYFILEDNTKTGFIQVLDNQANPFDVFALANQYNGVIATDGLMLFNPGTGYVADTTYTLDGGNSDATVYIDSVDESGEIVTFHLVNPGTGYLLGSNCVFIGDSNGAQFNVSNLLIQYDTSKGWYISTSDIWRFDTNAWIGINNIKLNTNVAGDDSTPLGTQLRFLVSVDGRTTWKAWNGSAWVVVNLADIDADGMSDSILKNVNNVQWALLFVSGTLDIVCSLKTTDSTITPYLSNYEIAYIIPGSKVVGSDELQILELSATTTTLQNIALNTFANVKANVLISRV